MPTGVPTIERLRERYGAAKVSEEQKTSLRLGVAYVLLSFAVGANAGILITMTDVASPESSEWWSLIHLSWTFGVGLFLNGVAHLYDAANPAGLLTFAMEREDEWELPPPWKNPFASPCVDGGTHSIFETTRYGVEDGFFADTRYKYTALLCRKCGVEGK